MESEATDPIPVRAKKLWKIMRVVFYMVSKGISKNKLMDEMLKRGQMAGKAVGNLIPRHNNYYSALTCRPDDPNLSFISPCEQQFSFRNTRPKHHHYHHLQRRRHHHNHLYHNADVAQKVFDMLNNSCEVVAEAMSPVAASPLMVRQLRVTDSPFSIKDDDDDCCDHINKAAEDFINNFYMELKKQKKMVALQSPSPYHWWAA